MIGYFALNSAAFLRAWLIRDASRGSIQRLIRTASAPSAAASE